MVVSRHLEERVWAESEGQAWVESEERAWAEIGMVVSRSLPVSKPSISETRP